MGTNWTVLVNYMGLFAHETLIQTYKDSLNNFSFGIDPLDLNRVFIID